MYANKHDEENEWFCFLTDSCVPIITPEKFRAMFFENYNKTIMSWKPAYWNINLHRRANLNKLNSKFHLANAPWFVLKKEDVVKCITYMVHKNDTYNTICAGGLANESIFAIILKSFDELDNVINSVSTITDWSRMDSPTSPHNFIEGNEEDIKFISNSLQEEKYAMFLRKVHPKFPEQLLLDLINTPEKFHDQNKNSNSNSNSLTITRKKMACIDHAIFFSSFVVILLAGIIFFMF